MVSGFALVLQSPEEAAFFLNTAQRCYLRVSGGVGGRVGGGGETRSCKTVSRTASSEHNKRHKLSAQATAVAPLLVLAPTSDQTARHGAECSLKPMAAGRQAPHIK